MIKTCPTINQRHLSYDIIRFFAILTVFSIHCIGGLDAQRDTGINIFVSNIFHTFQGIGVPLFLLLSGALLLGKQDTISEFLKKRMVRVVIPFLSWSIILFIIYYFVEPTHYGDNLQNLPTYALMAKFLGILFFHGVHGVYWFVYMILGLYLTAPILQRFLRNANEAVVLYACVLITAVFVLNILLPDLLVTQRMLSSNLVCLGYFLSGYYIKQYLLKKSWSNSVLNTSSILLLLLSFCNQYYSFINQDIVTYCMSISVFGALMKCNFRNGLVAKYITFVSRTSYGMYLSHVLLISLFVKLDLDKQLPITIVPLVIVLFVLLMETLIMYTIDKCKLSKYLGG